MCNYNMILEMKLYILFVVEERDSFHFYIMRKYCS